MELKGFKQLLDENSDFEIEKEETWTKEDLLELVAELEDEEDIEEVTELVLDILSYNDDDDEYYNWDDDIEGENVYEKMSSAALKKAAKMRKKPAFKKVARLKKKCMAKNKATIAKSNGMKTCNSKGKLVKGRSKASRRAAAKTRRKNKNKITK